MKANRFYLGMLLFALTAFLIGQAAPNACITPDMIAPQGEGSGLDADTVDGRDASAFLEGPVSPAQISPQGEGSGLDADTVDGIQGAELMQPRGVIKVYDARGQYLGVLASHDSSGGYIHIWIPALNMATTIRKDTGKLRIYPEDFSYESTDCSGTPHIDPSRPTYLDVITGCPEEGRYFVARGPQIEIIRRSRGGCSTTSCSPGGDVVQSLFQVIEIPPEDIPFTLPAEVPFEYVYE